MDKAILSRFQTEFKSVHPRLLVTIAQAKNADRLAFGLWELDAAGERLQAMQQEVSFPLLSKQPIERAGAFIKACALVLEERLTTHWDQDPVAILLGAELGVPADLFPELLLRDDELQTVEAFQREILDPWGVRAKLETDDLCVKLSEEFPELSDALGDDLGRELADALFGLGNDRYSRRRSVRLLQSASVKDRRVLAPLLVAFLDKTATDEDMALNAFGVGDEQTAHPICQDIALRILQRWGTPIADRIPRWLEAGVVSREIAHSEPECNG
jgi:hypothetical protein